MNSICTVVKLIVTIAVLGGCSSNVGGNSADEVSLTGPKGNSEFFQLTSQQLREQVVGKTLSGTSRNFPQVGPIEFLVYYAADGSAKDRLKFVRNGNLDRASGSWRIVDEQGTFCTTFARRRDGKEFCTRIFVSNDQFRSEPTDPNQKGVTGRVLPGDQVQ